MRRQERVARQERDEGDAQDTVYLPENPRGSGKGEAYHEDADCPQRQGARDDGVQEMTRADAQAAWFTPCRTCVLDDVDRRNPAPDDDPTDARTGALEDLDPSDLGLTDTGAR